MVAGARPNFVKLAGFPAEAMRRGTWQSVLVHTGQHGDVSMSAVFLEQFGLVPGHVLQPPPAGPPARMAHMMKQLAPVMEAERPQLVLVVGDVDGTLAAALTAERLGLPVAHLESGLRSGDRSMPEETNRILTDRVSELCFVTEPSGMANLQAEGITGDRVHYVGNTMIDTLVAFRDRIDAHPVRRELELDGPHLLCTLHRPATVDDPERLSLALDLLEAASAFHRTVFPLHPRTAARLREFGLHQRLLDLPQVVVCGALDYLAFQHLLATAVAVVTDSGGVQEETTWRGVPCLTLRPSTERPVTVEQGTNELLPFSVEAVRDALQRIAEGRFTQGRIPDLWDGHATRRVFDVLDRWKG